MVALKTSGNARLAVDATAFTGLFPAMILPYVLFRVRVLRDSMPGKKSLRGVSAKEQREYEHIKESAQRSGRYGKRAKEVAARTVMKQRKEQGHSPGQ
jgi:hypothetical protein